ncbi:TRPM2 [Mytilus coruscus]|uniref:TRPM2 n=1 Tax=Mytilus coruscus TaxID=42192 RepID=A0A6J8B7F7_MYTCO|nr:TRPM2 [Mytilus coruscus]
MDNGRKNRKTKKEINYRSTEIPDSSFLLKRKSKFREVFFAQIPENPDLLRSELSERWKINPPEAIISITGVHHQFNIKDKLKLKRNLINAVTKTGSWIITCGIESGVVQFIEDAVDEYITLEDLHVPIVGLLSQRVLHEMSVSKEQKKLKRKDCRTRMEERSGSWLEIPVLSTKETLDSNHTQFVFIDDSQEGQARTDAASEYPKIQTGDILPVVLVLIEGGRQELETAVSMLKDDNQVVVIDGSGGAANFLAALYREESDESLEQLKEECFEAYPSSLIRYTMDTIVHIVKKKKKEKIDVYSLNNKTTSVDQVIQNALFKIYTDDFEKKRKKSDDHLKIGYIKKQCKLVRKWNRCDLAEKHIFVARNRTELSTLQTGDEQTRTKFLKRMQKILAKIPIERHFKNSKLKDSDREESSYKYFKGRISKLDNEKDGYFTTFIESLDGLEKRLNREFDHVDEKLKKITGDEYTMTTCHKKMQNILGLIPEESSYKYLKRRISKLNDVKAGYFAYLNESLEGLKKRLERDLDHVDESLETLLRKTEEKIATKIEAICKYRKDLWAVDVFAKLENAYDLPTADAADAIYHQKCSVNLRIGKHIPFGTPDQKRKKAR